MGSMYQNKVNSLDCPKGIAVCWIGGNQAKGLKDISILVKFHLFIIISPPVNLKMRSRSPKFNQVLRLY